MTQFMSEKMNAVIVTFALKFTVFILNSAEGRIVSSRSVIIIALPSDTNNSHLQSFVFFPLGLQMKTGLSDLSHVDIFGWRNV